MDIIPFALPKPQYLYRQSSLWDIGLKHSQCAEIMTSRGCPSQCIYCSSLAFWGHEVRFRSIDNIIEEIKLLQCQRNVKQLSIMDDTFLTFTKRVEEFCDKLLAERIKINWWCYSKPDRVYPSYLLKKMRRVGCYGLNFGVESGNPDIQKRIKKNLNLDIVKQVIAQVHRHGFKVMCSFMLGLPGDTRETVMETINFAVELNPHIAQFCIATPFPGTPFYKEAKEKGWIETEDWSELGEHQRVKFHNDDLTSDEIYELYSFAHKKFYFRLRYFWLIFRRLLRHPREFRGYIYAGLYILTDKNG